MASPLVFHDSAAPYVTPTGGSLPPLSVEVQSSSGGARPTSKKSLLKLAVFVLALLVTGLIGGLIVTKLEDKYAFSALNRSPLADWK